MARDNTRAQIPFAKEVAMRTFLGSLITGAVAAGLLAGCMLPESRSGNVYTRDQARTSQSVNYGTILRVDLVTIEGTQTGAGRWPAGPWAGGVGECRRWRQRRSFHRRRSVIRRHCRFGDRKRG